MPGSPYMDESVTIRIPAVRMTIAGSGMGGRSNWSILGRLAVAEPPFDADPMTEREWARLRRDFAGSGYKVDEMPDASKDLHAELALANKITAEDALEWVASVYQMLPLDPSAPPVRPMRKPCFVAWPLPVRQKEPWMPLGNVGPLLIFAHYNPARGFWQVAGGADHSRPHSTVEIHPSQGRHSAAL